MNRDHSRFVLRVTSVLLCCFVWGCEGELADDIELEAVRNPLESYCEVYLPEIGLIDVETDYLPHVVQCENGAADYEALKAQAVAARSYLYYILNAGETIEDGTRDQVYSCDKTPTPDHIDAVAETQGQVIVYDGITICGFYVAGAIPSADDCIADEGDPDLFNTERFVTYNWGRFGYDVIQSPLGYVHPDNLFNRGCKSQNGAHCLSMNGWEYVDILKFYYGMDIQLERGEGSCISEEEPPAEDTDRDADNTSDEETDTDDLSSDAIEGDGSFSEDPATSDGCQLGQHDLAHRRRPLWRLFRMIHV